MKLLLLLLIPFFSIAQDSTYEPGDSTWITSSDTGKVKVYKKKNKCPFGKMHRPAFNDSYWVQFAGCYTKKEIKVLDSIFLDYMHSMGVVGSTVKSKPNSDSRTIHYTNRGNKVYDELCVGETWNKMAEKYETAAKYDTIGPSWKQVSHIGPGYNPVFAMEVYEVRVYKSGLAWPELIHLHFAWLDLGKKTVKYKVW